MKHDGDPVDGDMVNNDTQHVEAEGEGSSVCGRGKAVRRGGVQCKLPLSRISGFMGAPRVMCLFCERSFLSAVLLQKHTNRCHRVPPARRTSARNSDQINSTTHNYHPGCNFCNNKAIAVQKADDLPALFHHLLDRHSLKYFGCRPCEQRFSNSNQLKSHNQTIHPELLQTSSISNSESKTNDVIKFSSVQLPASETNKEKCSSISIRNNYESFETDLLHLNAKVLTKRVSVNTPSKSSTSVVFSENKKELRSRKNSSKTRSAKTLSKEISAIPPDTRQQLIKSVDVKNINSSELRKLQDAIVLIPPPPRDGIKLPKKTVSERDGLSESIDKKLSKMSRASVTLTPVQIKPVSNSDTQMLSRLGLAQNRSSRAQSLRRNRKAPSAETRSSSEVSRRDKSKGKNDNEFIINKNRNDPSAKFDPDFYLTVSNNVRENLLKYLDGKLEKSDVACDVPDMIDPKIRSTHALLGGQPAEIHGSDATLNAITIFPTLLAPDQYGSDKVPHYSYGANTQGFKKTITKNSWKWKWDITKKLKQIQDVGKRDLSRLDIWTQLAMRKKYDKDICKTNSDTEDSDVDVDKAERKRQINELNSILDRRVFPDIQSELMMSVRTDDDVENVADVKPDKTEIKREGGVTTEKLGFMGALGLAMNNMDQPAKESTVFSGEWQRPRCYVCCVCGRRADCLRLMEAHQASQHPYAQATYYELVGKEALDNQLYKHLYIPGSKRNIPNPNKQKKVTTKSDPRKTFKLNQSTRILRTTARNIKSQERPCTKCKKTLLPSELHRHILECAGDYGWMVSKKRCKNKPFGARRRRLKGLYKRERPQDDGERPTEKDVTPRPKVPPRPRSKPSDVETIQRMLANLPAKRASKQVLNIPSPKVRKVLNKNHILRRILPDSKLKRSKTTVVRTIKDCRSGKLRRVTRSITSTEPIANKNSKKSILPTDDSTQSHDTPKKVKTNTKSKKDEKKSEEAVSAIQEPSNEKPILLDVKKRRRNIIKESDASSSNPPTPLKETATPLKNSASSAAEESIEDNEISEKQPRSLRRRPETTNNTKAIRKRTRKINHVIIDKCADSNSENTQDNSNPILPDVIKETPKQPKSKTNLTNIKRKSKKVLGLPLKWIGKRGKVSKLKRKVITDNPTNEGDANVIPPLDPKQLASTPIEINQPEQDAKQLLEEISSSKVECVNEPVGVSSSSNVDNNVPVMSLSSDPRHSNMGFSNQGSQSHNTSSQSQGQYHHLYDSTVQGASVSNIGSKTAPLNYNHALGYYLPSSLQIISHSKHDKTFEGSSNMNKADEFAMDNIDKPPLFSTVRAQSQMKEMIRHEIPSSYMTPSSSLTIQKSYMQTNYEIAHNHANKSKLSNKSKRGLNDCIAMLRGKLTAKTTDVAGPVSSDVPAMEESNQDDESLQPLDLSGRCQAEDLSVNRQDDGPENLTVPKTYDPTEDCQEAQDLSMKSVPKTAPSKSALLSVRKPVFDPTLRIPQFSAPTEQPISKPSTSSVDQSSYLTSPSSSTTNKNTLYTTIQPAIELPSNISHELALLPQALVNTIEKLPPFQQEEIVKVLPQVLVKAVENYNLLRTESSKRQNDQDILKNISSLTTPMELAQSESPATREEHIRPKPTSIPQTSEISTQTSVPTKEEEIQKCPPEYVNVNTDLYSIDPVSGMISERKIDKLPNKIAESLNVVASKTHEVIDLTDETVIKEPEEIIPAAIIEKPKLPDSNVRSVVIVDPIALDKNKLERGKAIKGTASLRAVRIKSTSEKLKIKNLALSDKLEAMPAPAAANTTPFVPHEIKEPITKPVENIAVANEKEEVASVQQCTENTITSSKDNNIENNDLIALESVEPAIQQDEVSSTQHSSVEEGSDVSADITAKHSMSPLRQKLTDMQMRSKIALAGMQLDELSLSDPASSQKGTDSVSNETTSVPEAIDDSTTVVTATKPDKQKASTRKKRTVKPKEKKIIETSESSKLKENSREKESKEINPVVDKRDKCEPKSNDSDSDKKTSFNNLLKECNTLSESALTPSNVIDFHTERKALDKCENIQISEPIQDDADADRSVSVRRSLRSKKTILKESRPSIEKDTNIFENRDHNNDIEPIPDVPGAIIPEESYKANLGNTTERVDAVAEPTTHEAISNKAESDEEDDICLAAFSKKNTSKITSSDNLTVSSEPVELEQATKATSEELPKVSPAPKKGPKRKPIHKTKKTSGRQKKQPKIVSEPLLKDELPIEKLETVPLIPSTSKEEIPPPLDKSEITEVAPALDSTTNIPDSKKEMTRKSGRLKSQKESFASIDSVKLSENGHLIFKMHKEPREMTENTESVDTSLEESSIVAVINTDIVSPTLEKETLKPVTKHKKPRKSKGDNSKPEETAPSKTLEVVVTPVKPDLPSISSEPHVNEVPSKDLPDTVIPDKAETVNKNLPQKRTKEKIPVPLATDVVEDENDKPLIEFKKDLLDKNFEIVKELQTKKAPNKKVKAPRLSSDSLIKPDQIVGENESVTKPALTSEATDNKDVSNSSDEDIVLCKLLPKKKLKKIKSRSSPRSGDLSNKESLPSKEPAKDNNSQEQPKLVNEISENPDKSLVVDIPEINTPEIRKKSNRIKNLSTKITTPIVETSEVLDSVIDVLKTVDALESDKSIPVIGKRSTRKVVKYNEDELDNSLKELEPRKNKKTPEQRPSKPHVNDLAERESKTESQGATTTGKDNKTTVENTPNPVSVDDSSPLSNLASEKVLEDRKLKKPLGIIKTKAARKGETEEIPKEIVPVERVLSPRRATKKQLQDKEVIKSTETSDNDSSSIQIKSKADAGNTELPPSEPIISPRRAGKKAILAREDFTENRDKSQPKTIKTKVTTKDDEVVIASVVLPELSTSPRRSPKKTTTEKEVPTQNKEKTKNDVKNKISLKDDNVETPNTTPEIVLSPRRGAKKLLERVGDTEVSDKPSGPQTKGTLKEDSVKSSSVVEPVLSPRRTTKRSPPEPEPPLQSKEKPSSDLKTKATLKEDVEEPLQETVVSNKVTTPKKSKKKSILERELLIQPQDIVSEQKDVLNEVTVPPERVLSPRRGKKKSILERELLIEPASVEESLKTLEEILPPRRASKKIIPATELLDESQDKADDEPLSKCLRRPKQVSKSDSEEAQNLISPVSDDSEGKAVRRKSSRTNMIKETFVVDKPTLSNTEIAVEPDETVVEDSNSKNISDNDLSTIESDTKSKTRTSARSLSRSKPEASSDDVVISSPKSDQTVKNKKLSVSSENVSTSPSKISNSSPPSVKNKKKDLSPIIFDTTPNRKETTKAEKKSRKSLKTTFNKLDNDLHGTKKCLVSLDELDVDKVKQDLNINHICAETVPPSTTENELKSSQVKETPPVIASPAGKSEITVITKPKKLEKKKPVVPSALSNPDIIESSDVIKPLVTPNEKIVKRKSRLDSPRTRKQQIVHVDVHVPKEDSNMEPLTLQPEVPSKPLEAERATESCNKTKKHKKKSKPNYSAILDDDLSSEEPLLSMVEAGKRLDEVNAKLSEGEVSDKTDSSTCLANLLAPHRKTKKKKAKASEKLNENSARKIKRPVDVVPTPQNEIHNFVEDSFSDSDSLIKLKSDKLKSGVKRKRKTSEAAKKVKQPADNTDTIPTPPPTDKKELSKEDSHSNVEDTSGNNALPVDPESIQDKYLADFGMYTEKRPRKSTLLAMKKISKTFKQDGEDNSDDNQSGDDTKNKKSLNKKVKKVVTDAAEPPREEITEPQSCKTDEQPDTIPDTQEPPPKVDVPSEVIEETKPNKTTKVTEDGADVIKKPQKTSENYCALCKRKFRRHENLLKHQMTLIHISRVSEVEAKEMKNNKSSPSQGASRVHKNLAERKSFDNKIDVSPSHNETPEVDKDTPNPVAELATDSSSRKELSTDEALFFECCSLLKESSDIPLGAAAVEPPPPNTYPLPSEQNNSSSDSTPYISGVKHILKASQLLPPSLTGESDNTVELSQTDSNSEILHSPRDKRMFAFANKNESCTANEEEDLHFLTNDNLYNISSKKAETTPLSCTESEGNDAIKKCSGDYDPYSAESLMVRTNSDDFSENGDSMISSQDADNIPNKSHRMQRAGDKSLCEQPPLIFEDKFDKIKRKAREKAQAAKEAIAAVITPPRIHSKKSGKKSGSKSRRIGGEKKSSQQGLSKPQKCKNKSKKRDAVALTSDKGNSKKVLTKAALKGFDSVKVSISSQEINFQDVIDTKSSTPPYQLAKDKHSECNDFEDNNEKVTNIEMSNNKLFDMSKKTLSSFGKSSLKEKQKPLLNYDSKIDSPIINDKHDIYEFMDDEDDNMSDSFKFRTPTAINRASSSKKGEMALSNPISCTKSSLDVQNDDSQISSLSFSDRDDFTYMSDDYNANESEDETNHSSNSLEGSTVVSKSSKKHKKSTKHRNIKKNAIMGKIFKNNAIRNNEQSPSGNDETENVEHPAGAGQRDMDQLFDSLFEQVLPESSQATESENKASADVTDTDDMYSAGDEIRIDEKVETSVRSPSPCESDSDNDDDPNPIPAYPRTSQRKIVPRLKARSSDDESMQPKPQSQQQHSKKSEIGVASHKSQRKCTTGKQNVLVESWSSESDYEDFRQFEEYSSIPRSQKHHRRPRRSGRHRQHDQSRAEQSEPDINSQTTEEQSGVEEVSKTGDFNSSEHNILESTEPDAKQDQDDPNTTNRRVTFTPNIVLKNKSSKRKRRQSQKPFDYDDEFKPTRIAEPLTTQRRIKRAASEMLYYWSSSSDDDMKNASTDVSGRESEPVEQHGWIVGDSHKKLVTMLAHAKGRKVDDNSSVKEKKSRPSS